MARNTKTNRRSSQAQQQGNILPFITGLSIGLFIAFVVYLKGSAINHPAPEIEVETLSSNPEIITPEEEEVTFDFYKILPEREVKVPQWEPPKVKTASGKEIKTGAFVFQVGSFQKHSDADKVKAKLALLGFPVEIQRVVINGQKIWFRVRVGPYKDQSKLNSVRQRLSSNNMDYILLSIKDDA
ncbi:MAG: SPOR domain-containing protein [Gammaproteobacteria bacterium]